MKITFLGTGTSVGVPVINCQCEVCRSADPRDHRLRTSALVETRGRNFLIDCGPDFRTQMLRLDSPRLDALLVTHTHYDHLGGIDDLRPYCSADHGFPIYCRKEVARDIHVRMPYCFEPHRYPGAPRYDIHIIHRSPFKACGIEIIPLPVFHAKDYEITGFRIGRLSYVTDCKTMPEETLQRIMGSEVLVINALRFEPHNSHMTLDEALTIVGRVNPRKAYLIHFSHDIGLHAKTSLQLPPNVIMAHDTLSVTI